jgi:hypothetical protein
LTNLRAKNDANKRRSPVRTRLIFSKLTKPRAQ